MSRRTNKTEQLKINQEAESVLVLFPDFLRRVMDLRQLGEGPLPDVLGMASVRSKIWVTLVNNAQAEDLLGQLTSAIRHISAIDGPRYIKRFYLTHLNICHKALQKACRSE